MADAKPENERMSLREYQHHCQGHLPGAVRLWVEDLEREKAELEERFKQLEEAARHVRDELHYQAHGGYDHEKRVYFGQLSNALNVALSDLKKDEEAL